MFNFFYKSTRLYHRNAAISIKTLVLVFNRKNIRSARGNLLRIIDKNKDYYDYLAYQADSDDGVTFDRRGSIPLRSADFFTMLSEHVKNHRYYYRRWFWKEEPAEYNKFFAIRAGVKFFLIGLKLEVDETDFRNCILKSYKMELIKIFEDFDYRGKILDIVSLYDSEILLNLVNKKKIENIKLSELISENLSLPDRFYILKNIGIPSIISPEEIYYGIETYLFSLKNDKHCESKNLTDSEKIVNHGFDKKTSFRNM